MVASTRAQRLLGQVGPGPAAPSTRRGVQPATPSAPRQHGVSPTEVVGHAPEAGGALVDGQVHQPGAQRCQPQRAGALRVRQQLPELEPVAKALLALRVARLTRSWEVFGVLGQTAGSDVMLGDQWSRADTRRLGWAARGGWCKS
jgi:hypothetical protein